MGQETVTITDQLQQLDETLDNFELQAGLPQLETLNVSNLVEEAMQHDFKVKLTPEKYGEYAAVLSRHSLYLQRVVNKQQSRLTWIDDRITRLITPRLNQQKSTFYPEKRALAIAENEATKKLQDEATRCKIRIERLNYIAMKVENMAEKYVELQRTLRTRRVE